MCITDGHFVDMMGYENTKRDIPQVLVTQHCIKCYCFLTRKWDWLGGEAHCCYPVGKTLAIIHF